MAYNSSKHTTQAIERQLRALAKAQPAKVAKERKRYPAPVPRPQFPVKSNGGPRS